MAVWCSLGLSAAMYGLYKTARPFFRVRVNCWFCLSCTRVAYEQRNGWVCQDCDQYNGFKDDGDYNWENPDWYKDVDWRAAQKFAINNQEHVNKDNGLCQACNRNQNLKVHQLSKFVPVNPGRFDQEVEEYSAHLERTYRLCRRCEAIVHQTLGEQDSWLKPKLLSWRLELNRQTVLRSAQIIKRKIKLSRKGLTQRAVAAVLSALIFLHTLHVPEDGDDITSSVGDRENENCTTTTLQVISGNVYRHCGLLELVSFAAFVNLISTLSRQTWTIRAFAILSSWILLLIMCTVDRFLVFPFDASLALVFTSAILAQSILDAVIFVPAMPRKRDSPKTLYKPGSYFQHDGTALDDTLTQDLVSTVASFDQSNCSAQSSNGYLSSKSQIYSSPTSLNQSFIRCPSRTSQARIDVTPCDISTLSIDGESDQDVLANYSSSHTPVTPTPFRIKPYSGHNVSGINFGATGRQQKIVLRPSKFDPSASKGVVKTSWVAGGYWESKRLNNSATDDISRSSSQSSGFVSHSSANAAAQPFQCQLTLPPKNSHQISSLPNSRVNSTCGDFLDRFSVFSEPAYNASFNLSRMNGELLNFSTAKTGHETLVRTRTNSQADSSFDSSLDKLTQEAFADLHPKAESSPIPRDEKRSMGSILEKQISLKCSLYSLLLTLSVFFNVFLAAYLSFSYIILDLA